MRIGKAALSLLEVVPGVTIRQLFARGWPADFEGNVQIGRSPPLSSDKAATHFPAILRETDVPYDEMLFFDDCNWGDHCANVANKCKGVATQRTPRGMQYSEWIQGLKTYNRGKSGAGSAGEL